MPSIMRSPGVGARYWRSINDLENTPEFREFVEKEFPSYAPELLLSPTRRQFIQIMGASLALAGLTGCRWPRETIVPATKMPENRIPGTPVEYATVFELAGVATGLLVKSYDGRPIKIEGNDKHPFSRGKTDRLMQASVLELYDPDRSTTCIKGAGPGGQAVNIATFEKEADALFASIRAKGGTGFAVLAEPASGSTFADMRVRFQKVLPNAKWYEYHPLSRDYERDGSKLVFGKSVRAQYDFTKADVIVAIDSDFLMTHPASVRYMGDYASRRNPDGNLSRFYAIEAQHSLTGSNADERIALRPSQIGPALQQIAAAVGAGAEPATKPIPNEMFAKLISDLKDSKGKSILIVGERQPAEVHAVAHLVNGALGNFGQTVSFTDDPAADRPAHVEWLKQLVKDIAAKQIDTLLILGANPVYNGPADVDFAAAIAAVPTTLHSGLYRDETGVACTWHVPAAHYLEAWGDARAWDGTLSIQQPLIDPLYFGKSPVELLAMITGDEFRRGYDLVRRTFKTGRGNDWEAQWVSALHDGVVPNTAAPKVGPTVANKDIRIAPSQAGELEVLFAQDYRVYDGRFGNNAWLQELPDPMTKMTWDNAAYISPADAQRWGVRGNERFTLTIGNRSIDVPVWIIPGQAAGTVLLPLGYGRKDHGGVVAKNAGFNTYKVRSSDSFYVAANATMKRGAGEYELVGTQDHHAIESEIGRREAEGTEHSRGRLSELFRETTLADYKVHRDFAKHIVHLPTLQSPWTDLPFDKAMFRWGMSIDLSTCTGCSACVTACQSENNIPVVGKKEVALGREMHWIRIDRYFRGDRNAPTTKHQPVPCMHCENAPCEQVCPVAATVHDHEGINVMVYNRCVGTRYCSNNCPYKVRRFNWFYNHQGPSHPRSVEQGTSIVPGGIKNQAKLTEVQMMVHNPNVTVRSRGVMEKCTYCIQRINAAKIKYRNDQVQTADLAYQHGDSKSAATLVERFEIPETAVVPACAQACPAGAITFGNLADEKHAVTKLHKHDRTYAMLEELNHRQRTRYLARITNPIRQSVTEGHGGGHGGSQDHEQPGEKKTDPHNATTQTHG